MSGKLQPEELKQMEEISRKNKSKLEVLPEVTGVSLKVIRGRNPIEKLAEKNSKVKKALEVLEKSRRDNS